MKTRMFLLLTLMAFSGCQVSEAIKISSEKASAPVLKTTILDPAITRPIISSLESDRYLNAFNHLIQFSYGISALPKNKEYKGAKFELQVSCRKDFSSTLELSKDDFDTFPELTGTYNAAGQASVLLWKRIGTSTFHKGNGSNCCRGGCKKSPGDFKRDRRVYVRIAVLNNNKVISTSEAKYFFYTNENVTIKRDRNGN